MAFIEREIGRSFTATLESLGVRLYADEHHTYLEPGIKGLLEYKPKQFPENPFSITINPSYSMEDIRFTIAHEMAHLILGHLAGDCSSMSTEEKETEANQLGYMIYLMYYKEIPITLRPHERKF